MKVVISILTAAAMSIFAGTAIAQDYPSKPITFVVPFPPGANLDIVGRTIASIVQDDLGQSVIVENKIGAAGVIGVEAVRAAAPDGYTVLVASNQQFAALPQMRDAPYSLDDFKVIRIASQSPVVFTGKADLPYDDVKGLVEYAKQNPGKVRVATSGPQSASDIDAQLLARMAGIDLLLVPYSGAGPSVVAQLGGEVDVSITVPNAVRQHVAAGTLKYLGSQTVERTSLLPDVPTLAEQGYDIREDVKVVFLVRSDTSAEIIERLDKAIEKAIVTTEFQELLKTTMTLEVNVGTTEGDVLLRDEFKYWTESLGAIGMLK